MLCHYERTGFPAQNEAVFSAWVANWLNSFEQWSPVTFLPLSRSLTWITSFESQKVGVINALADEKIFDFLRARSLGDVHCLDCYLNSGVCQ